MDYIKEHCPAFQKGKFCPYNVPELKGLAKGCPAFKDGCPFKGVKDVGEFEGKLGEMRDLCKGKANYEKALKVVYGVNGQQAAKIGHCPFFKFDCPFKTDREGKPIVPELVTMQYVEDHCPVFNKGKACPYNVPELKGLGKGCPEFKDGCPFKNVKDVGEFKAKMGEMRDNCKGKENYTKAMDLAYAANGEAVAKQGHCPFFKGGCFLKTDTNGRFIIPDVITMDYVKGYCPAFDKGKACPYNVAELKGLGKGCPSFKDGCPFKAVKDVGEFKAKLAEMRDQCKCKQNYTKALECIYKANAEEAAKIGHCTFNHNHCELKTDKDGKPIV
ncbi:uncharacterized protein LOC116294377 [Actinia tenebrosa]|uniref:Uncharacterized protein LOC116294377 n=1 Tax=Actinia tenebrosa TaxID=6105 RepID=A0A6P8HQK4_ACTTE|nr:uncharacterized protein LOC116294377 [Actinia tenebrosa]